MGLPSRPCRHRPSELTAKWILKGDGADADVIAEGLVATGEDPLADAGIDARVLRTIAASYRNFAVVASREAELREELGRVPEVIVDVPNLDADVHDLGGLARIAESLFVAGP